MYGSAYPVSLDHVGVAGSVAGGCGCVLGLDAGGWLHWMTANLQWMLIGAPHQVARACLCVRCVGLVPVCECLCEYVCV